MTIFSTMFASYMGCAVYYWISAIKKSIKEDRLEKDIELKWKQWKTQLYIVALEFKRKRNTK